VLLPKSNKQALEAMQNNSVEGLNKARQELKEMSSITEKIDNDIVIILTF